MAAAMNDAETVQTLNQIEDCQTEIEVVNEQSREEVLKVEQEFNLLRKPHFDKRAEIIRNVPKFWSIAFLNQPDLNSLVQVGEEECFKHLITLDVEEFEDVESGYRIHFHFEENPYFENAVLTKEFQLGFSEGSSTSLSTPIQWKEGMNLTTPIEPTCTGQKRPFDRESFFSWYQNHTDPASDTIAEIIKDDLWQNPLYYFLVPVVDNKSSSSSSEDHEDETAE